MASLWMMGAVASFTAMAIAARQINQVHDSFEIMMARSGIGFFIVLIVGAAMGQLGSISMSRLGGHALRNLVHFTGQNLWFWALGLIPLAQLFALEFTSPIWVILLSPILGSSPFNRRLMLLLCFQINNADMSSTHSSMQRVLFVQRRLPKYRVPLLETLRPLLAQHNVALDFACGTPNASELRKEDEGSLSWGKVARTHYAWHDQLGGRQAGYARI